VALSPCLLVLALSVAHAGGSAPRRPAVQVEELARPADDVTCCIERDRLAPASVALPEVRACVTSSATFVTLADGTSSFDSSWEEARAPHVRVQIVCSLPLIELDSEFTSPRFAHHPLWPPTDLRWQAAPIRPWRTSPIPASSLPLFWLHERPPLTWPTSLEQRPWHPPIDYARPSARTPAAEPRPVELCGGELDFPTIVRY
jgi:hypothetical protein